MGTGFCHCIKVGRVCAMRVVWTGKEVSSGTVVYTLPSTYRPIAAEYCVRNSFDNQSGELSVYSNGQVTYSANNGSAWYGRFAFAYITA